MRVVGTTITDLLTTRTWRSSIGGMGLLRTNPDDKAAKDQAKSEAAFHASPAGQARLAFQRGDKVFQLRLELGSHKALIAPMMGATTVQGGADDTSADLNRVCFEGWDLFDSAITFVQTGQESRDKFMASGQNVATSGEVVGYYLFKRAEHHKL